MIGLVIFFLIKLNRILFHQPYSSERRKALANKFRSYWAYHFRKRACFQSILRFHLLKLSICASNLLFQTEKDLALSYKYFLRVSYFKYSIITECTPVIFAPTRTSVLPMVFSEASVLEIVFKCKKLSATCFFLGCKYEVTFENSNLRRYANYRKVVGTCCQYLQGVS